MRKLQLSKIDQFDPENFDWEDYRDTIFRLSLLSLQVTGAGNHDHVLYDIEQKTYMSFDLRSPFGIMYLQNYSQNNQ